MKEVRQEIREQVVERSVNGHVLEYLRSYLHIPDPRFAVFIHGKWGCGKSFFINKWVEEIKLNNQMEPDNEECVVLEPVSVSLYGMRSIQEVTDAINREIHPVLYHQFTQGLIKVGKILGKAALKTDLDLNGNGKGDMSISMSLDSLSVFRKNNSDVVKGNKLLIFDDVERSMIDLKELLGFINSFVEKCGCHLIIIGDSEKFDKDKIKILEEFQEKTIGKSFLIYPDTDNALQAFLDEVPQDELLSEYKDLLKECFNLSEEMNLRSLRRAIIDLKEILQEVDFQDNKNLFRRFLVAFVITSLFYARKEYINVIKEYGYKNRITTGLTTSPNGDLEDCAAKWDLFVKNISKEVGVYLSQNWVSNIYRYLSTGISLVPFLNKLIENEAKIPTNFEKLFNFIYLENEDFLKYCKELESDLPAVLSKLSWYEVGKTLNFLSYFKDLNLYNPDGGIFDMVITIFDKELSKLTKSEEVVKPFTGLKMGCQSDFPVTPELEKFLEEINCIYQHVLAKVPDRMQELLLNLNDENVAKLIEMDGETVADKHTSFQLTAIFEYLNADDFFQRLMELTNVGKQHFNSFLRRHYRLDHQSVSNSWEYRNDLKFLEDLLALIQLRLDSGKSESIEKLAYENLVDTLNKSINRIKGKIIIP